MVAARDRFLGRGRTPANPAALDPAYNSAQADIMTPETWVEAFASALGRSVYGVRIPEPVLERAGMGEYVLPIPGRPGYSFWNVQDITARHEMEAVIRDERNKLVDFLDEAPIGFYSVDAGGRFLFVNQTLAKWLGGTPAEILGGGGRLHDFLAQPPAPGTAPPPTCPRTCSPSSRWGRRSISRGSGRACPSVHWP